MSRKSRSSSIGAIRSEARPLTWAEMNQGQKGAFVSTLRAIKQVTQEASSPQVAAFFSRNKEDWDLVDPVRSSRVLFLSGARGTGKTSVYASLRAGCLSTELLSFAPGTPDGDDAAIDLMREAEELLGAVRTRVVWLEPLDMEPLPGASNLLAALMVRLQQAEKRAFGDAKQAPAERAYDGLSLSEARRALEPVQEVRRLIRDIAIAWDGNLRRRGARIDLDTYGAETERVENARLSLAPRLRRLLEALATCYVERRVAGDTQISQKPIFVLPVDDFDLNPTRAVDLMHLLRMISTPRLFILVLGDYKLAEVVFNLKIGGDFARLIQYNRHEEHISMSGKDLGGITRQVSANALRKLLPPSQRVVLGPLSIAEAISFSPLGADCASHNDDSAGGKVPTLGELLAGVHLEVEARTAAGAIAGEMWAAVHDIKNLRDLLLGSATSKVGSPYSYTGAGALVAPPRHVSDLWYLLHRLTHEVPPQGNRLDPLLQILAEEARRAFDEDERLPIAFRERFLDAVSPNPDGIADLWTDELVTGSRLTTGTEVELDRYRRIAARRFRGWHISASGHPEKKAGDRTLALLVLLHDLLALRKDMGIVGKGLAPDPFTLGWAQTLWYVRAGNPIRISWPAPRWSTFLEFDLLRQAWEPIRARLETVPDTEDRAVLLAYVWIAANTAVVQGELPVDLAGVLEGQARPNDLLSRHAWLRLVERVAKLAEEYMGHPARPQRRGARSQAPLSASRRDQIESWLVALACLLAPESGLPARRLHSVPGEDGQEGVLEAFCDALAPVWSLPAIAGAIRTHRARRLTPFIVAQAPQYFRALGSAWPSYLLKRLKDSQNVKDPSGTANGIVRQAWQDTELFKRGEFISMTETIDSLAKGLRVGVLRLARLSNANPINRFNGGDLCPGPGEERSVNSESGLLSAAAASRRTSVASRVLDVILDDLEDEA